MSYIIEIDSVSDELWDANAGEFPHYTIYQTWAYQSFRASDENQILSRIIIFNADHTPLLMCMVRIKKIPLLGLKVGYAQWGPLLNYKILSESETAEILKVFRNTYITNRVDILRIVPNIVNDDKGKKIAETICLSGFDKIPDIEPYHTIYIPVADDEQSIRNRLHRSWRKSLKKSEQNNIEIREGDDIQYFNILENIYTKSKERKQFTGLDHNIFISTQEKLQKSDKMRIIIAYSDGTPVSAHASSYLGEVSEGILAGSTEEGLRQNSSYLVWWHTLVSAHRAGMKAYNLGGIDPKGNPSVYQFKMRMGGEEVFHIGTFDAVTSNSVKAIWRIIDKLYRIIKS